MVAFQNSPADAVLYPCDRTSIPFPFSHSVFVAMPELSVCFMPELHVLVLILDIPTFVLFSISTHFVQDLTMKSLRLGDLAKCLLHLGISRAEFETLRGRLQTPLYIQTLSSLTKSL